MNSKVRDIFTKAAVLPTEEREQFLETACGSDAELRLEVQRLLEDFPDTRKVALQFELNS